MNLNAGQFYASLMHAEGIILCTIQPFEDSKKFLITLNHFKQWQGILLQAWQRILLDVCEPLFHSIALRAQSIALRPEMHAFL
jgi:hypothetical protein